MLSADLKARLGARSAKPVLTALHLAAELSQQDVRSFESCLLAWRDQLSIRISGLEKQAQLDGLLSFFYHELAFSGDNSHFTSQGCLLTSVIHDRKGSAAALGLLLLYFADSQDVALDAIDFPGYLLLTSPQRQDAFLDPLTGAWHPLDELELWLRGLKGNWQRLQHKHTEPLGNQALLLRLLKATKGALTRDGRLMEAVKVTQAMVELSPDDPYLIRDRGYLLAELNCVVPAKDDLSYFVEHCPDDPACALLRSKMKALPTSKATLH